MYCFFLFLLSVARYQVHRPVPVHSLGVGSTGLKPHFLLKSCRIKCDAIGERALKTEMPSRGGKTFIFGISVSLETLQYFLIHSFMILQHVVTKKVIFLSVFEAFMS